MKLFFIVTLTLIMCLIGNLCTAFYFLIKGFQWYHLVFQLGSLFIIIPASMYWLKYFKKLFKY